LAGVGRAFKSFELVASVGSRGTAIRQRSHEEELATGLVGQRRGVRPLLDIGCGQKHMVQHGVVCGADEKKVLMPTRSIGVKNADGHPE
jgi:hypothetical protein